VTLTLTSNYSPTLPDFGITRFFKQVVTLLTAQYSSDGYEDLIYHRLRGSASPVLTATHHSYGSPRLSDFFSPLGSGGQTPQRTFTQNGSNDVFSRKDVPFAVKIATFHTP